MTGKDKFVQHFSNMTNKEIFEFTNGQGQDCPQDYGIEGFELCTASPNIDDECKKCWDMALNSEQ